MTSRVGMRIPAYGTAIGKALLMDTEFLELKKLYPNGLKALTENTITDFTDLSNQLSEARLLGYTCEMEESTQYIRCFAVPIQKKGKVVAAISVAIPIFRYTEERAKLVRTLLFDSKNKIETILNNVDMDMEHLI